MIKAVIVSLICLSASIAFANSEQGIIGSWQMTDESCSDGSKPAGRHEDLWLKFDGQTITTRNLSAGCFYEVYEPYVLIKNQMSYTVKRINKICGAIQQTFEISPPEPMDLTVSVNEPNLQMFIDISWPHGVCPVGTKFLIKLERR